MPTVGMAPGEVYLGQWLVAAGGQLSVGDVIAVVETDKAEVPIEAEVAGTLSRHLVAEGDAAPAGSTIGWVLEAGDTDPSDSPRPSIGVDAGGSPTPSTSSDIPTDTQSTLGSPPAKNAVTSRADRTRDPRTGELSPYTASPRARAGQSTLPDAAPRQEAPAAGSPDETATAPAVPAVDTPDRYRAAIARAVSRSWAEIPHFAVTRELRSERLHEVLAGFRAISPEVTLTDVVLKAFALSLIERFDTKSINLGIAVATTQGVAIPVLPNVATADLLAVARLRKAAVERALAGERNGDDDTAAHSTISNLGALGVDSFTGIVPVGQTSLLTVGRSAERPVVEDGVLVVGHTMHVTLNVDHRVWDGSDAALVLRRLAGISAQPGLLLALGTTS